MIKIAITGSLASGKSSAAKLIEKKKYKLGRSLNGTELFSQYFLQLEGKLNGANLSVQ